MDKFIVNQRLPHSSFSDFANNVLLPIYKPGWREALQGEVTYPRTQRNDSGQGLTELCDDEVLLVHNKNFAHLFFIGNVELHS